MRALIIADDSFARRETPMLARLEVGLAGEGVRVVRAVPKECLPQISAPVHSTVVGYEMGPNWFTRRGRTRRLLAAVAAALEAPGGSAGASAGALIEEPELDVVHCFGHGAVEVAVEAARMTGAGVALEVWSGDMVGRSRELTVERAGREGEPPLVLFTPDVAIARELRGGEPGPVPGTPEAIEVTPWGVHAVPGCRPRIDPEATISAAVLADGVDSRAVLEVIDALGELAVRYPNLLIFFDGDVAAQIGGGHAVWQRAKRRGILDRLSMVGGMEGHREPILHVDLLIQPEAVGAHHSLTLDAMAAGVVVVAREDPMVDALRDGRTAVLVKRGAAAEWVGAIEGVLKDPERAQRLRESARAFVREERTGSGHVAAVLRGYERLAGMREPA